MSRASNTKDKSSLSNHDEVKSTGLTLQLNVDFNAQQLEGWVEHLMVVKKTGTTRAVFDTSDITVTGAEVDGVKAKFKSLPEHKIFGTPLEITLKDGLQVGGKVTVRIYYRTSPSASASQWLPSEQTAGKKWPYLFTQSQAIHARSIIPCQDAPAVKVTYRAKITAPNWATVLMSALREADQETMDGAGRRTFVWQQPVPVPSYLIAMAVGDLDSREISHRVRVWAEPSVVDAAAHEFSQTEEFLQHAEALSMPYVWQRYDLLCLPPSFPYGGMENPCLTFVTPTLLAGDRSLADVVAHEISHSWSGNLVTNATWEHFWLNEGWTMWLQRKIVTRTHRDPLHFDLDAYYIGWEHLVEDVKVFTEKGAAALTALIPEITDVDPDDAFSSVPYEKGFCLLYYVEQMVGTPAFEAFAKVYFNKFKFGTVTSEEFRQTLVEHFKHDARVAGLPWEDLFFKPGLPPMPRFNISSAKPIEALADGWYDGKLTPPRRSETGEIPSWSTLQKQIFLERLLSRAAESGPMKVPVLGQLDAICQFSASKNAEISFRWNVLCLRAGAQFILPNTVDFVTTQGRMKYTRPLYREMFKSGWAKDVAIATFKKAASTYHPICRKMVASDLGIKEQVNAPEAAAAADEEDDLGGIDPKVPINMTVAVVSVGVVLLTALVALKMRKR